MGTSCLGYDQIGRREAVGRDRGRATGRGAAVSVRFGEAVLGSGPADTGPYRVALVVIAGLLLAAVATGLRMPRDGGELARRGIAR
jgi:hypothetical protein